MFQLHTTDPPLWKILILDSFCQSLVSCVLRVGDLREHGITLHLYPFMLTLRPLHGERAAVADVPAIYFVEPTADNLRRIIQVFFILTM